MDNNFFCRADRGQIISDPDCQRILPVLLLPGDLHAYHENTRFPPLQSIDDVDADELL